MADILDDVLGPMESGKASPIPQQQDILDDVLGPIPTAVAEPRRYTPPSPIPDESAAPSRGVVSDVITAIPQGIGDLVATGARAYRGGDSPEESPIASKIIDFTESLPEKSDIFKPSKESEESYVRGSLTGGVKSAITSLGAGIPGALAAQAALPIAPGAAAIAGFAASAGTVFGLAEYDSFMEEARNQGTIGKLNALGLDGEKEVKSAAFKSALVEGGVEAAADIIAGRLLKIGKVVTAPVKASIRASLELPFKTVAKDIAKNTAMETSTEMLQGELESYLRRDLGMQASEFGMDAIATIGPTVVMSSLMGLGAHGYNSHVKKRMVKTLQDPAADKNARLQAASEIGRQIHATDPALAKFWREDSGKAIEAGTALDLDENLVDRFSNKLAAERTAAIADPASSEAKTSVMENLKAVIAEQMAQKEGKSAVKKPIPDVMTTGPENMQNLKGAIAESMASPDTGIEKRSKSTPTINGEIVYPHGEDAKGFPLFRTASGKIVDEFGADRSTPGTGPTDEPLDVYDKRGNIMPGGRRALPPIEEMPQGLDLMAGAPAESAKTPLPPTVLFPDTAAQAIPDEIAQPGPADQAVPQVDTDKLWYLQEKVKNGQELSALDQENIRQYQQAGLWEETPPADVIAQEPIAPVPPVAPVQPEPLPTAATTPVSPVPQNEPQGEIGKQYRGTPLPEHVSPNLPKKMADEIKQVLPGTDLAAHGAASSPLNDLPHPTEAQIEAGNYAKGHIDIHGLDISVENPKGSIRSGTSKSGKKWSSTLKSHYGYLKGTIGRDKEHIDAFIGGNPESQKVYVIDQMDPETGKFDEHKIMLGFNSKADANIGYHENYEPGWKGAKAITETTMAEFKAWLKSGNTKKEFAPAMSPLPKVDNAEAEGLQTKSPIPAETEVKSPIPIEEKAETKPAESETEAPKTETKPVPQTLPGLPARSTSFNSEDRRSPDRKAWDAYDAAIARGDAEQAKQIATRLAYKDRLTGLTRREGWQHDEAEEKHAQYAKRFFMDLDNFHDTNALLTHEGGDQVLAFFGKLIRFHLGNNAEAARWGGDEFVGAGHDDLESRLLELQKDAEDAIIPIELKSGETREQRGIRLSFGIGKDYAEAYDANDRAKADRQAAGLRRDRDATIPGRAGEEPSAGSEVRTAVYPGPKPAEVTQDQPATSENIPQAQKDELARPAVPSTQPLAEMTLDDITDGLAAGNVSILKFAKQAVDRLGQDAATDELFNKSFGKAIKNKTRDAFLRIEPALRALLRGETVEEALKAEAKSKEGGDSDASKESSPEEKGEGNAEDALLTENPESSEKAAPVFEDWRIQGSWIRHSAPTGKLTGENAAYVISLMKKNGIDASFISSRGMIKINSGKLSTVKDLWEDYGSAAKKGRLETEAAKTIADEKAARGKSQAEELAKNPAVPWIEKTFGPEAMNDFNKLALARFLNGDTKKFEGLTNHKWLVALEKMEAVSKDGTTDFDKIKASYEASAAVPGVQTVTEPETAPAVAKKEPWQRIKADYASKTSEGKDTGTEWATHREETHRREVEMAIKAGKDVPADVLSDYPDLINPKGEEKADIDSRIATLQEAYDKLAKDAPANATRKASLKGLTDGLQRLRDEKKAEMVARHAEESVTRVEKLRAKDAATSMEKYGHPNGYKAETPEEHASAVNAQKEWYGRVYDRIQNKDIAGLQEALHQGNQQSIQLFNELTSQKVRTDKEIQAALRAMDPTEYDKLIEKKKNLFAEGQKKRDAEAKQAKRDAVLNENVRWVSPDGKNTVKSGTVKDRIDDYISNGFTTYDESPIGASKFIKGTLTGPDGSYYEFKNKQAQEYIKERLAAEEKAGQSDDSDDDTSVLKKPELEVKEVPGGLLVKKSDKKSDFISDHIIVGYVGDKPKVSANTIFTEDAAEKARKLLRSKLSQTNMGLDPEILQAGITLAGYHIEKGARTFSAYAKAMIADLGESVKPYLKSWYVGVKFDPRAAEFDGMDKAADVENADLDTVLKSAILEEGKEQDNDNTGDGVAGQGALEGQLPKDVQKDGEKQRPAKGERSGGEDDAQGDGSADAGGGDGSVGVGGEPGPVHPGGPGAGLQSVENPAPVTEPRPLNRSGENPGNYQITESDIIGKGTRGNRIDNNLAAIRLVKTLDKENRYPTRKEQSILARYVGWGGLKNVFDESSDKPQDKRAFAELKATLTENEFFEARQSIQDAHYTERGIIDSMFDIIKHLGIKGGHFLEPTFGVGLFPGLMPSEMSASSKWYGSEMDVISAKIGQYLFPRAQFLNLPFQETEFPYEKLDVAIGNPPFGDWRVTDTNKKRSAINGMKIHNYIIAKSGMHVKPGGVMAFVVTQRFLDTADPEARNYLGKHFKFLGAVRLPNTAFKENAGTDVTTDIVLFQKPLPGENALELMKDHHEKGWFITDATMKNERGEEVTLNKYFADHPENMLGIPSMNGKMWRRPDGKAFTLEPREGLDIRKAINNLLENELSGLKDVANQNAKDLADALAMSVDLNKEGIGIGGYFLEGDTIYTRLDDDAKGNPVYEKLTPEMQWTEKAVLGTTRYNRIKGMLGLRAKAYELIRAERFDMEGIEPLRKELNALYDSFVEKFGFISESANSSLMSEDAKIEAGLESKYQKAISASKAKTLGVKQSPARADKATLLKERVYFPTKEILHADNVRDGYGISLSEKGKLDIPYIATLTNKTEDEVSGELAEAGLIFKDPKTEQWIQEDAYLSGNVKQKLKDAEDDPAFSKNVDALKKVLPKDVVTEEVFVDMGATWIPRETYQEFAGALGIEGARILVIPETGRVSLSHYDSFSENELSVALKNDDYSVADVFSKVANHQALVAYDPGEERGSRVVNRERTKALIPIGKKISQTFRDWIFANPQRAEKLTKIYNETQNTHAPRKFDGSKLKTVGANPAVRLYRTQTGGAWRMIQSLVTLLDHSVGAGKTNTIITGVQERKRMGISNKPIIIVPNHIVGQWARDYATLYPGANILAASEKDFSAPNRKRLLARMATGKYDAIIIGHSSLSFIPLERDTQAKFVREEMQHLEKALKDAEAADDKRTVRSLTNRIEKKREKIKKLMDMPKNDVATWESMGIDYVVVDESQEFKNLEYSTFMQSMAGMGTPTGSLKAFDLYAKLRYTRDKQGGVTFATGTPISNSLVEMYSLLRYLNKEEMDKRGLGAFDAWAKSYAGIENRIEYTATQKLKDRLIMTSFNNMPELKQLYLEFADVVSRDDLKHIYTEQMEEWNKDHPEDQRPTEFPEPKVKGGGRQLDLADSLPDQKEYMDYLVARAEELEGNSDPEYRKIDNHLWVMSDARKMALDVRLVDPKADPGKDNKIDRTSKNVKRLYDKWNDDKGTQLVFCDLSTPLAQAEKTANAFINSALKKAGLDRDATTKRRLESMAGSEKWDYIRHQIQQQIERLSTSEEEADMKRREALEEYLMGISDEDAAALTTMDTKFSVYDELKAKLIGMGIPAGEIKFIHEANTKDQKEELFALVNSGQVRVLIGSSKKMGAGTNVQERLVGLHHMDAPWRPSDVEQREGRIIRQGNALYERDPKGFEAEIISYSTRNTFDAVMWQILARKAGMIESLKSDERSVQDQSSDSASYADFMAESTGSPAFKEKFKLESEIEELESVQRRISARRASAEGTIKNSDRDIQKAEATLQDRKEGVKKAAEATTFKYMGKTYQDDLADGYEKAKAEWSEESKVYEAELAAYDAWEKPGIELAEKSANDKFGEVSSSNLSKWVSEKRSVLKSWTAEHEDSAPKKPKTPVGPDALSRVRKYSKIGQLIHDMQARIDKAANDLVIDFTFGALELRIVKEEGSTTSDKTGHTAQLYNYHTFMHGIDVNMGHGLEVPTRLVLELLSSEEIRKALSKIERKAVDNLARLQDNIKSAQLTLDKVKFDDADKLAQKKARYTEVVKEVAALEEKVSKDRGEKANKYISADSTRFPGGYVSKHKPISDVEDPSDAEGQPLFSRKDTEAVIKHFDRVFGQNVRIPSAIKMLDDMVKNGIIGEEEAKRSSGLLSMRQQNVMPKAKVLEILGKEPENGTGRSGSPENVQLRAGESTPAENRAAVEKLQNAINASRSSEDKVTISPAVPLDGADASDLAQFAHALGTEVVYVKVKNGKLFDGVNIDEKHAFIDVTTKEPHLALAGHEIVHAISRKLRRTDPAGLQQFRDEMVSLMQDFDVYHSGLKAIEGNISREFAEWELIGDFIGNRLTKQSFWKKLVDRSPAAFQKIYAALKSLISRVTKEFNPQNLRFWSNIERAETIAAKFVADYERKNGPISLKEGEFVDGEFRNAAEGEAENVQGEGERIGFDGERYSRVPSFRQAQVNTPAFKEWFKESKVVDENGEPLVVYHGTAEKFSAFDIAKRGNVTMDDDAYKGFFFTNDERVAEGYANGAEFELDTGIKEVMPVYLSVQKLKEFDMDGNFYNPSLISKELDKAQVSGFDGVVFRNVRDNIAGQPEHTSNVYAVFSAEQIKSATANTGAFSAKNPDIRYSRRPVPAEIVGKTSEKPMFHTLRSIAEDPKAFMEQYKKAFDDNDITELERIWNLPHFIGQQHSEFGRIMDVEEARQENRSEMQNDLLAASLKKNEGQKNEFLSLSKESRLKVSKYIIKSDQENRTMKNEEMADLTSDEKSAYWAWKRGMDAALETRMEFLEKMNTLPYQDQPWFESLKRLIRIKNAAGQDVMDGQMTGKEAEEERERYFEKALAEVEDSQKAAFTKAYKVTTKGRSKIGNLRKTISELKFYMPRQRAGEYVVKVYKPSEKPENWNEAERGEWHGDNIWDERATTKAEATANLIRLKKEYPGMTVIDSIDKRTPDEIFNAVNDVAIEKFIEKALNGSGISEGDAELLRESMLESAANEFRARGWEKHGIHRSSKYIGGYQTDHLNDVFVSYMTGLAGSLTKMEAAYNYAKALEKIDMTNKPNLYTYSQQFVKDMLRNQTKGDKVVGKAKALAFTWYITGKLSMAAVQLTQNYVTGIPHLSRYTKNAGMKYQKAMRDVALGRLSDGEKAVLKEFHEKGLDHAKFMEDVMGKNEVNLTGTMALISNKLSLPFTIAETFNRKSAFMAAYRVFFDAKRLDKDGIDQRAFMQAKDFVNDTHYLMGKANKPEWARGASGGHSLASAAYTFTSFSHNMALGIVDAFKRGGNPDGLKVVGQTVAYLALFGGLTALPFMDDLLDELEKLTGIPFRKNMRKSMKNAGGETLARFGMQGIPAVLGADLSGSIKMGIPFKDGVSESVYGVYGGLAQKATKGYNSFMSGDFMRGLENISPVFAENVMKGYRMSTRGATNQAGKVMFGDNGKPIKLGTGEMLGQMAGLRPARTAALSTDKMSMANMKESYAKDRQRLYDRYRTARNNMERAAIRREMQAYNRGVLKHKGVIPKISDAQIESLRHPKADKSFAKFMDE